jgi:hypothetical protein
MGRPKAMGDKEANNDGVDDTSKNNKKTAGAKPPTKTKDKASMSSTKKMPPIPKAKPQDNTELILNQLKEMRGELHEMKDKVAQMEQYDHHDPGYDPNYMYNEEADYAYAAHGYDESQPSTSGLQPQQRDDIFIYLFIRTYTFISVAHA